VKDSVTTDSIFDDAKRLGKSVYKIASIPELGVQNPGEFFERMDTLRERAVRAFENGCYIEYLSLILLHIEVWLRIYLLGRGAYSRLDIYKDRLFFGKLIHRCADAGMDQSIIDELQFLNTWRVDYIHGYLKKSFDYSTINAHRERLGKIPQQLSLYVARMIGTLVTNRDDIGNPGDIVTLL